VHNQLTAELASLDPGDAQYASRFVEVLLAAGRARGATDLHLQPTPAGLELRWRVDGIMQPLGTFPPGAAANVIARLKVLAGLLTYRSGVPQEGHIQTPATDVEVRVCTFPTLHGERIVVRLFNSTLRYHTLDELQLPGDPVFGRTS
jgi:type II secretory ATPase GspE/PulE/Tfp pilus assembly ATPase PilB-like protein